MNANVSEPVVVAFDEQGADQGLASQMLEIGRRARAGAALLATASTSEKNSALNAMAAELRAHHSRILRANMKDLDAARTRGLSDAMIDRLTLSPERIDAIAQGLEDIAALPDPVGETVAEWDRPNGLHISRVRVPIGVLGVIYESRPNVTADAGGLALKSGNAIILRGGSDSFHTSSEIADLLTKGLSAAGLPEHAIQYLRTTDRDAVGHMLTGLNGNIDVIVPRGGRSLVERVQTEARVPVFSHLEGICHVYVDASADMQKARDVVLNAKMRRTGICGAAETLLLDSALPDESKRELLAVLLDAGCEVRGDNASTALDDRVDTASTDDWDTEYLDAIISVAQVDGVDGAIDHIARHSSGHTEAILAESNQAIQEFTSRVDSAIIMVNASTQFADGGEFGMGAEIGIATGKMHARGPVGVEQLTSFKYIVRGSGQTRPL